jgi:hypothetical protein
MWFEKSALRKAASRAGHRFTALEPGADLKRIGRFHQKWFLYIQDRFLA